MGEKERFPHEPARCGGVFFIAAVTEKAGRGFHETAWEPWTET